MSSGITSFQSGLFQSGLIQSRLLQSGIDLEARPGTSTPAEAAGDDIKQRDGLRFAGIHLIVDLWGARGLDDPELIERALRQAAEAAGAKLLHVHLHRFSGNGGISGVMVLAESHISIHTWPERGYAALDVFMCGGADPRRTIPVLRRAFRPERIRIDEIRRGA